MDEGAAQAELLLHAARELPCQAVREGIETGRSEKIGDACLALGASLAEEAGEEVDILPHAEIGVEVPAQPLRHVGDARADGVAMVPVRHVTGEHVDPSRLDPPRAGDEGEQRGLADAVRPDNRNRTAGRDLQVHPVQRGDVAIALGHALQRRDRRRKRGGGLKVGHHRPVPGGPSLHPGANQTGQDVAGSSRT